MFTLATSALSSTISPWYPPAPPRESARRDSKAGLLAPRHRRDSRGLRLTSVTATRKITNHECNQERRAGVALDAGDRSEGAFYCPVQGGGGGAGYSGAASQIAEIVDAFPWLEMKQRFARAVCWVIETNRATHYDNFARDVLERLRPGYK